MPIRSGRVNRGPAAADANRQALLDAARRVLAEQGYRAPLSAIAKAAGVGQGVLYRHFPTRLDLALAVFEENFAELEGIVAAPGPDTFPALWTALVEQAVGSAAFVEMVVDARATLVDHAGERRLRGLVDAALPAARQAGTVDPELTPDDVLVAWRMVFGVVWTSTGPRSARLATQQALALLPGLPAVGTSTTAPPVGRVGRVGREGERV